MIDPRILVLVFVTISLIANVVAIYYLCKSNRLIRMALDAQKKLKER